MSQKNDILKLILINSLPLLIVFSLVLNPQSDIMTQLWMKVSPYGLKQQIALDMESYQEILSQQPWHEDILGNFAELQYEQEDFSGVIASLTELNQQTKLNFSQELLLADAYLKIGNLDLAKSIWKKVSGMEKLTPENYLQIFQLQKTNGDWKGAYSTIQLLAKNETQNPDIQYQFALFQIIFDPKTANDSLISSLQGRPSRAERIKSLQFVVEEILKEDNQTFRMVLAGRGLANQGEWLMASAAFEQVTNLDPNYAEGWAFYGNALNYLGKNGFPALQTAEKLDPNSKIVRAMLAVYWRNNGDSLKSLEILNKLIADDPNEAYWFYETGNSFAKNGGLNQALAAFYQAIDLDPKNIFYWKELANFCLNYSFLVETEGLTAIRQALILNPDDPEANDIMGMVYVQMNNYANAERFLLKANKFAPYSATILLHLGQLYYLQNENNLAYFYLQSSVDYSQNDTIKTQALSLLDKLQ